MCSICCIWFPSRDESSVRFNSCCLVTGGVQTFIALLLFPTCTSVAQRRRSFHNGHAAQASMKRKWLGTLYLVGYSEQLQGTKIRDRETETTLINSDAMPQPRIMRRACAYIRVSLMADICAAFRSMF